MLSVQQAPIGALVIDQSCLVTFMLDNIIYACKNSIEWSEPINK